MQWFWSPQNEVCHCFHCFSICHEVMGPDAMTLAFWTLTFKSTFSLSSFTFIKKLFSSSSLSAIRLVSSAYLSLLIFLLAILIPDYASSSPAFLMIYSAPDGQHRNQIDYILCSQRWRSSIQSGKKKTRSWLWLRSWTPYWPSSDLNWRK